MNKRLEQIHDPSDLKNMNAAELKALAREIRHFLVEHVSKTGGHLSSNLGIVELTLALHRVLESPRDKIVWDVGHQAYVHKILTGRQKDFDRLRQTGGLSGFPKPEESVHDVFAAGHSSISISAALGMAKARDLRGETNRVVAVIGDGALTGGVAFEGLNNAGRAGTDLLVILNDNEMSISRNVGALSRHLMDLRTRPAYHGAKESVHKVLNKVPVVGEPIEDMMYWTKDKIKALVVPGIVFEELGFQYVGPVDGHDLPELLSALQRVKLMKGPVLLHVRTVKGKGYPPAQERPSLFHGVGPFDRYTGVPLPKSGPCYSEVFGKTMVRLGETNPQLVAVTAAMTQGTGLTQFAHTYPDRFFDVGIAEQHAVTFCAGLAAGGLRPVFAVYSTFLQRAYDQLVHDVGMQSLPVVFAIDRAGIVGPDGETHQGVFDLSYLSHIPNFTVLAPKDGAELSAMLEWAVAQPGPVAVRYPKDVAQKQRDWPLPPLMAGQAQVLREGRDVALLAVGEMTEIAAKVCDWLEQDGFSPHLVNLRFIKPLDRQAVEEAAKRCSRVYTLEDNVETGGVGACVAQLLEEAHSPVRFHGFAFPDAYLPQGSRKEIFEKYQMDAESIYRRIRKDLQE